MTLSATSAIKAPIFHSDFAAGGLDSRLTFTRASNAWYYNASGTLTQASSNAPRFDYNPATLALNGLLIEEARTNKITNSNTFGVLHAAITTNAATAPDGTTTAIFLKEDASAQGSGDGHEAYQQATITSGTTYAASVFMKAATRTKVRFCFVQSGIINGSYVEVDLSTGTLGTPTAVGTGTVTGAQITALPNGWYRIALIGSVTSTAGYLVAQIENASTTPYYTGDGASGIYLWGAQIEQGTFPTSYIPTSGAAATRAIDSLSLASPGWFSASKGSLAIEAMTAAQNAAHVAHLVSFNDGTANNVIVASLNTSYKPNGIITISGTSYTSAGSLSAIAANATFRAALVYKATASLCAAAGTTDGAGTFAGAALPTGINALRLGDNAAGTATLNGWLRKFNYWNVALPTTQLQTVTT